MSSRRPNFAFIYSRRNFPLPGAIWIRFDFQISRVRELPSAGSCLNPCAGGREPERSFWNTPRIISSCDLSPKSISNEILWGCPGKNAKGIRSAMLTTDKWCFIRLASSYRTPSDSISWGKGLTAVTLFAEGDWSYGRVQQHLLQRFHLLPQLPNNSCVRILVDHRVINDPLRSVRVSKGGKRFLVIVRRGRYSGHHYSFTVPAKVILESNRNVFTHGTARGAFDNYSGLLAIISMLVIYSRNMLFSNVTWTSCLEDICMIFYSWDRENESELKIWWILIYLLKYNRACIYSNIWIVIFWDSLGELLLLVFDNELYNLL